MGLAERRESASPRLQTPGTNPRCPSICQPTQQTHTHWKAFSGSSMARRQGQQQSHQCRERGAATDSNLPRSRSRRDERWPGVWPLASVAVRLTNRRGRCQETKSRLTVRDLIGPLASAAVGVAIAGRPSPAFPARRILSLFPPP